MSDGMQEARLQRYLLGLLALLLLGGGIGALVHFDKDSIFYLVGSMAWRIGLTLAVLCVALPQVLTLKTKIPPRVAVALVASALILAVRPKAFPLVILALLALAALEAIAWLFRTATSRRGRR